MPKWLPMTGLFVAAFAVAYAAATMRRTPSNPDQVMAVKQEEVPLAVAAPGDAPAGMVWIPGGEFSMGSDSAASWADERPAHRVRVRGFWMDATEVTNAEFKQFVDATDYLTTAELTPSLDEIMRQSPPGTPPPDKEVLVPGSLVFTPTAGPVPLDNFAEWWRWTPGANWRHPEGPDSNIDGKENHPVVQVSWDDAAAYAKWAGKRLPTEAEWEFAARGGLREKAYVWGDEAPTPARANIWQGNFPYQNSLADGFLRTAPVKTFPANGFGLYDMPGNVWEWCADWYDRRLYAGRMSLNAIDNPTGPAGPVTDERNFSPQRVQRGGSFLCSDEYCSRYRPSARHGCTPDTGMSHVGFRCVKSPEAATAGRP